MLSKPDAKVTYEGGVAVGVTSEGETAQAEASRGRPQLLPRQGPEGQQGEDSSLNCLLVVQLLQSFTLHASVLTTLPLQR